MLFVQRFDNVLQRMLVGDCGSSFRLKESSVEEDLCVETGYGEIDRVERAARGSCG